MEVAGVLDPQLWMLVGGLMVHVHAHLAGIRHDRPTNDIDVVLLPGSTLAETAAALSLIGYQPHESLDLAAPFHRFTRGAEVIDVMAATEGMRFRGRPVLEVPGARSASSRIIEFTLTEEVTIRLPDLASALSLKGAALATDGASRARHARDGITLLACANGADLELSNSMRRNVNRLVTELGSNTEAWLAAPLTARLRATRTIDQLRPGWTPPGAGSVVSRQTPGQRLAATADAITNHREGNDPPHHEPPSRGMTR